MQLTQENIRWLVTGTLLVHGLGHGGALGALIWMRVFPNTPTGDWLAARSWLFPALRTPEATTVAMTFWTVAMIGFVLAAASFLGVILPGESWRAIAVGSAIVSLAGMTIFYGTWPAWNWLASLAVNVAIFFTQLVTRWPSRELLGQ